MHGPNMSCADNNNNHNNKYHMFAAFIRNAFAGARAPGNHESQSIAFASKEIGRRNKLCIVRAHDWRVRTLGHIFRGCVCSVWQHRSCRCAKDTISRM